MQMHGAKPLTVPLQQARLRPALPLSSPKTPMSPVVGSSWLLRAISSSDVPPDRPSRQGLSSSVIIGNKRKQGGWPPCPTAQVLLVRRLHTICHGVSKRNAMSRVRCSSHLAAWGEIGQRHVERRRGFCVPAFGGYLAGLFSGRAPPPPRPGSPPCAAAIPPNLTSSSSSTNQHNTTQHNTHPGREREKQKKKQAC